jgi:predicted nucleic acid-binding protein
VVIVDTTVWIDYLNGTATAQTDWLEAHLDGQRLGLTDIILCEVLQGVRLDPRFEEVRSALLRFEVHVTGGIELATVTAQNYRRLRAAGRRPRTTIDGLIATFCLLDGHLLLHSDRDFDHFEEVLGLSVIHP